MPTVPKRYNLLRDIARSLQMSIVNLDMAVVLFFEKVFDAIVIEKRFNWLKIGSLRVERFDRGLYVYRQEQLNLSRHKRPQNNSEDTEVKNGE